VVWTTNTYDGSGRTLTTTLPDGSVTTYLYQGNTTKTTDSAGKWKKQTADAFGNLTTVNEPNPAGGADFVTTYTYNTLNQMTQVSMPRPYQGGTYTQTRTFVYAGQDMTSETNPENGTTTYDYNADHQVTRKTQSNGQQTRNVYDAYGRLSQLQHWGWVSVSGSTVLQERLNERVDYVYDSNGTFSQNAWGRLAAVVFHNEHISTKGETFTYQYSYNQAGRITAQRVTMYGGQSNGPATFDASYEWDNEGRMTKLTYPGGDLAQNYGFDSMGRLSTLNGGTIATYGVAGEMTSFNGETRTYNSLFQLTRINAGTAMDIEYNYTAGANNGRIASSLDHVTGENVTYTYDSLNRLTAAATADSLWGNAYTYDGWGNLLSKTVTKGTAPTYSTTINPANNGGPGQEVPSINMDVDVERRILASNGYAPYWSYDPGGKRIFKESPKIPGSPDPNAHATCEFYFYGITGQKLATYTCQYAEWDGGDGSFGATLASRNEYFAGKPLKLNGVAVRTDRLGSVRWNGDGEHFNYYPYGEERGSTANGREKFGTYYRDSTGPDYADQRYYDPTAGRFTTPDRYQNGVGFRNPSGWNRFAYSIGDPINFRDPQGTNAANPEDSCRFDEEEDILHCSAEGTAGGGGGPIWESCDENPFQAACAGPPISDPEPIGGPNPDPPDPYRPECDRGLGNNAKKLDWIVAHGADAATAAAQIGTTDAIILGLSALESGWGTGPYVVNGGNNYFSQHAPAPGSNGSVTRNGNTMATYASYLASALGFDQSRSGQLIKGITDPTQAATTLQNAGLYGINRDRSKVPNFVSDVAATINGLAQRLDCPK
jgi:RHS repeat-associated protein